MARAIEYEYILVFFSPLLLTYGAVRFDLIPGKVHIVEGRVHPQGLRNQLTPVCVCVCV